MTDAYYSPQGGPFVISCLSGERIVTWTLPHMRAERAFQRAGELLSIGQREDAIVKLEEAMKHQRDLIAILNATPQI